MYRDNAAPPKRTLLVRPEPAASSAMLFGFAAVLMAGGVGCAILGVVLTPLVVLFAIPHFVVGGALLDVALRGLRTVVRFEITHDAIVIQWRRGLRTLKTQRLDPADVIDVHVDRPEAPALRPSRLVVRTRLGDVALSDDPTAEHGYAELQQELASFLGVTAARGPALE